MFMFELSARIETLDRLKGCNLDAYDAVYAGDPTCPLVPGNLSYDPQSLEEGIKILKDLGKQVYLSLYAEPRNEDLGWLERIIEQGAQLGVDAFEVHNLGVLRMVKKKELGIPVHVGPFANVYTAQTASLLGRWGTTRVAPNPELSFSEIVALKEGSEVDVILQAHGKLPLGISETCFLLEYREGECKDVCFEPCWLSSGRWKLKNIGRATLSGKDFCLLEYLGTFYWKGFRCFSIMTLREDPLYIERVGAIYKAALSRIAEGVDRYLEPQEREELSRLSPEGFCNGYLFRRAGHRYIGRFFGGEKITPLEMEEGVKSVGGVRW